MTPQEKFARAWCKLLYFAAGQGIKVICTALFRTEKMQHQLYLDGKSKCDGLIKVSKHQLGRAGDLCVMRNNECIWEMCHEYQVLADYWKGLGGIWGGDFSTGQYNDLFHMEM